ncbi:cation diffusion facilitator family transporter [Paracoccus sp. PS-1]|uniref:cation diffusion facilitator family transporter n=1 Tax=unclassified Paracoccus (in: a-proteobacteria) TaxID=2688777 RepID=UPI00049196C3|nr:MULTISPECIES: cation diffusion facilitator family transporter [unclassified Paracoccus (in: a-proteobacteria)]MDQ7262372.1 cation diffusion facilitator family transporter [Paracoccus sp. PS1]UFM63743.1 cation diffusion facilitator family transporter [Paracoccus sp. MA]
MGHSHSHSHDGGHGHAHLPGGAGDGTILVAVVVNLALTGAQIIGGYVADSTALIADGVHNLSDALALVLAFGARRLARRPASPDMSYGWGRAEIVAAFVNYIALIAVSVWLGIEALGRLIEPPQVAGGLVMALAGFALLVDMATAALVWRASKESVNIRAAFLHNLADAAVSVAVILGGALIWAFGWNLADPVLTLLISAVILWHIGREIGPVMRMLMLAAPAGVDHAALAGAMAGVEGVAGAHHLHLWQIDERRTALSAHLVMREGADPVLAVRRVKALLRRDFGIDHATIETERAGEACGDDHAGHRH